MSADGARRPGLKEPLKPSSIVGLQAVVASLVWGATYGACDTYLAALGTSPAAVGLSINTVLFSLVSVGLAFLPAGLLSVALSAALRRRFPWLLDGAPLAVAFFFLFVLLMGRVVRYGPVLPALILCGAAIVVLALANTDLSRGEIWSASVTRLFAVTVVSTAIVMGALWITASADAKRLDSNGQPHGFSMLLNLRGRPVCLTPTGSDTTGIRHDRPLLLLGSDSGVAVLYDRSTRSTFEAPRSSFVMRSVTSTASRCG